jgi:lysophospholipase L1-like esterase
MGRTEMDAYQGWRSSLKSIRPQKTAIRMVIGDSLAEGMAYKKVRESLPKGMRNYKVYFDVGARSAEMLKHIKAKRIPRGSTIMVFTGTNDLIRIGRGFLSNSGEIQSRLRKNIKDIIKWAERKGIRLVFSTIPPCGDYRSPWNLKLKVPGATMQAMKSFNRWLLRQRSRTVKVIDLSALQARGSGGKRMDPRLTWDGLHPNTKGYVKVAGLLQRALGRTEHAAEKKLALRR